MTTMKTSDKIKRTMDEIRDFLISKNEQYGDSVMYPIGIFSDAKNEEALRVRIDDKLNRLNFINFCYFYHVY